MRRLACMVVATVALAAKVLAQQNVPEPDGYRTDDYRSAVPATLKGVRVVTTTEAEAIWRAGNGDREEVDSRCTRVRRPSDSYPRRGRGDPRAR